MPAISQDFLEATQSEEYGFCTEFMIEGKNIDLAALRSYLSEKGGSLIVIGDSSLAKVHIHTFEPDEVIAHGATLGSAIGIKVDDISQQHQGFLSLHGQQQAAPALAVVAVAWGEGFVNLFDDLGCHAIVPCQRTMNPSAQELLEAARTTGAENVVILPNNSNVILTARQAASIADGSLHVIPTRSQTQGIASLLSYVPDLPHTQVLRAMEDSIDDLHTVEVTTAHRDTIMDGKSVARGHVIGLLDGVLTTVGDHFQDVAHRAILAANPTSGAVVTLYWGGAVQEYQAQTAAQRLLDAVPGVEVETVFGGQPFYHYIASIE
jgi:dihydroxyacetone kinase-like predicted kinase